MKSLLIIAALCVLNAAATRTFLVNPRDPLEVNPSQPAYRNFLSPKYKDTPVADLPEDVLYPVVDFGVKRQSVKNYDVTENKHSRGQVAYFLDVMDAMFLSVFKSEANQSYENSRRVVRRHPTNLCFLLVSSTSSTPGPPKPDASTPTNLRRP